MVEPGASVGAGHAHIYRFRVYHEDIDAGGIVYYANYLKFAERARTEMIGGAGISQSVLLADPGVAFVVRRCTVDYRAPARLDDEIEVHSRITALGGASLEAEQRVVRLQGMEGGPGASDGVTLAALDVRLGCVNLAGRAVRFPAAVRCALARIGRVDPGS